MSNTDTTETYAVIIIPLTQEGWEYLIDAPEHERSLSIVTGLNSTRSEISMSLERSGVTLAGTVILEGDGELTDADYLSDLINDYPDMIEETEEIDNG